MKAPHVIPYQGSKRKLANKILELVTHEVKGSLYEPFAGSAATTLAAVVNSVGNNYVIGDKYVPLIELWRLIITDPHYVGKEYEKIWKAQIEDPKAYFLKIRDEFNEDNDPIKFLYLVARCVKNAIRFNADGLFNQSADNRRLGMRPEKVYSESQKVSSLLNGKAKLISGDFMKVLKNASSNDLVYMDPPWQGTSLKKDPRYAYLLDIDKLVNGLTELNSRNIPYLLSFDGTCGDRKYGNELPKDLELLKVGLHAGRSTQATLLGRNEKTIESLYLSPALVERNKIILKKNEQIEMFA